MKVRAALALAYSSLAYGSASMKHHQQHASFGPKSCVSLSRSAAGSCIIATDCEGIDLSTTEFAFDCTGADGIVRHSFGTGGFDSSEEFDTEVKCDKCEKASPADVVVKPAAPVAKAAPVAPKPAPVAPKPVEVSKHVPAAPVVFKAQKHETVVAEKKEEDPAKQVQKVADDVAEDVAEVLDANNGGSGKKKSEVARYGPDGCVSTWKSKEDHCIMRTDCAKKDISKYEFGLVCVDKVGSPVRHLFGKDSFDKEETFDTLIKCDKCLGLEDVPDAVALNGEVVTMSKDIANLKAVMTNISINVQMLNEEVFKPAAPAPGPASAAAPSAAAPAAAKSLLHHSTSHSSSGEKKHNLRHSHKKHRHEDDDDDDEGYDDDDRDESDDVQKAVLHDDREDEDEDTGDDE